jgi:hypothetical protein
MGGMIVFTIDGLRLVNIANVRWHWAQKARMAANHKSITRGFMNAAMRDAARLVLPLEITLVRIGPGTMDSDNLAISGKHVRDSIAECLGLDDGHPMLTWKYRQEKPAKGAKHKYGVRCEIREQFEVAS